MPPDHIASCRTKQVALKYNLSRVPCCFVSASSAANKRLSNDFHDVYGKADCRNVLRPTFPAAM
jgi:hypothetical protein